MEQEFDILSFTADQLAVNNQAERRSSGPANLYKPKPADAKSADGVYRATIKVIYNPFDLRNSVLDQQSYALQDAQGFFSVVSSLTNNDTNCPIFKAWKTCRYSKDPVLQHQIEEDADGNKIFDKRYARYVVIQVIDDPNNTDLNGSYLLWKCPKAVWDTVNAKQKPAPESGKASVPVMDFLFGRSIDLEVVPGPGKPGDTTYTRQTSYRCELSEDVVSCTNPDGSSLLNDSQQEVLDTYVAAMKKVWKEKDADKRNALLAEVNADENTKVLRTFYKNVIEKIKTFCPNLMETLGYKEWTAEVKTRVQKWIDIVLSGNDPRVGAPVAAATAGTTPTPTAPVVTDPEPVEGPEDDLPF